ncbi:hypothetical protein BH10PAT1_BH10PAT1_3560 [soil metagenome]
MAFNELIENTPEVVEYATGLQDSGLFQPDEIVFMVACQELLIFYGNMFPQKNDYPVKNNNININF